MKKIYFFIISASCIPLWVFIVAPQFLKLPKNFTYSANIVSIDNQFDENTLQFKGEKYSNTVFSYSTISSKGDTRIIKNTFDVRTMEGEQIFKAEPVYAIDAITKAHIQDGGDMRRNGFLFAPANLSKNRTFDYWHVSNNYPSHMKFVAEENIYGLRVFRFEKINTEAIDQTMYFTRLPDVPEKRGIKLSSNLSLWIEPVTGHLIKFDESSLDYYYFDISTGEKIFPYNKFSNRFSEESILEHVNMAQKEKLFHYFVIFSIPALFTLIVLFLLLNEFKIAQAIFPFIRSKFVAIGISSFVFILSLISFFLIRKEYNLVVQERFITESKQVIDLVKNRVNIYQNALLSANALFAASVSVSKEEWDIFIKDLLLVDNYPGIQSIGFAPRILDKDKNMFVANMQQVIGPAFSIFPPGKREFYVPITFVVPQNELNNRRLGFDTFSDTVRHKAMKRSLELNQPVISGKIIYDDAESGGIRPGFGMYLPVLQKEYIELDLPRKDSDAFGYVFATFRAEDFMSGLVHNDIKNINFHIYDDLILRDEALLYEYHQAGSKDHVEEGNVYRHVETIFVSGHPWTFEFVNSYRFVGFEYEKILSWVVLVGGVVFSLLIFAYINSISSSKLQATLLADDLTKNLRKNKIELENKNKNYLKKLEELNKLNKFMVDRELQMIKLKNTLARYTDEKIDTV